MIRVSLSSHLTWGSDVFHANNSRTSELVEAGLYTDRPDMVFRMYCALAVRAVDYGLSAASAHLLFDPTKQVYTQ